MELPMWHLGRATMQNHRSPSLDGRASLFSPLFYGESSFGKESPKLFEISPSINPNMQSMVYLSDISLPINARPDREAGTHGYIGQVHGRTRQDNPSSYDRSVNIPAHIVKSEFEGHGNTENRYTDESSSVLGSRRSAEKTKRNVSVAKPSRRTSKGITLDDISQYFHLPINDVAKELGVCATVIKKICRKAGIPRWPHRKIKSIQKAINDLEASKKKRNSPTNQSRIDIEIRELKNKLDAIVKNPQMASNTKKVGNSLVTVNSAHQMNIPNNTEVPDLQGPNIDKTADKYAPLPMPLKIEKSQSLFISPLSLYARRHSYPSPRHMMDIPGW